MTPPRPDLEPDVPHQATVGDPDRLHALARRHGVQRRYTASDGRRRTVPDAVLVKVLEALDVEIAEANRAGASGKSKAGKGKPGVDRPPADVVPPVALWRAGDHRPATVAVAPTAADEIRWVTLTTEDGTVVRRAFDEVARPDPPATSGSGGGPTGARSTAVDLRRLAGELPGGVLEPGYHHLSVETRTDTATTLVIAAPDRCPAPTRCWGISSPLYALRGSDGWGAGSLSDLGELARWAGDLGGTITGTLPLYAGFLDGPHADPSPYRPASRLAWNEVYLDLDRLPEVAQDPDAGRLLGSSRLVGRRQQLDRRPLADLPEVLAAKRSVLQPVAASFLAVEPDRSPRRLAFDRWVRQRPDMVAYARFRARLEQDHGGRAPDDPAVAYHLYAQWVTEQQLGEVAGHHHLYLDLPVGVHPDGFDPWWEPDAFATGASIGSPPDTFFADGQRWGLPPLHPERIRRQGYRHLIDVVRRAMAHAGVLRLDHVMGLHRLWLVPDGSPATHGAYVRYHDQELRAIVTLEAHRAGTVVVGEDLGTVPGTVRRAMRRDGMLRSSVWQFEASGNNPTPAPVPDALATLGTHDLAPFAAVVADRPELAESLGPDLLQALRRCLVALAAGEAAIVLVDLADLWLETTAQNRPGQPSAENFSLRARRTLAELHDDRAVTALLHAVDTARTTIGVSP